MLYDSGPEVFVWDIIQQQSPMIAELHQPAQSFLFAPLRLDGRNVNAFALKLYPERAIRVALASVRLHAQLERL